MILDRGASDHLVDVELIPRLRDNMNKKLKESQIIVTAGNKEVLATATGTIWGHIIDQAGQWAPVRISAMIIPGLGRNLFSSVKAMNSRASTILKTGNLHIQQFNSNISLPLNQHPEDTGLCSYEVLSRPGRLQQRHAGGSFTRRWNIATRGRIYCLFIRCRTCYIGWGTSCANPGQTA